MLMASAGNIARESTTGYHCPTCTCVSHDVSRDTYDFDASSSESEDDDISSIDEEIARMSDALIALKRRRNARLPITHIPAELLSEIFVCFRNIGILPARTYWKTLPSISIAHVCIRWRSVALADPRLWDTVNLRFPNLVRNFSTRFGAMPLHVVLSSTKALEEGDDDSRHDGNHYYALDAILESHNPICSLRMKALPPETNTILRSLLPRAADHLLYLAIGLDENYRDALEVLQNTSLPTLQSLSLENVSFKLSWSVLESCGGSLRELKLNGCWIEDSSANPLESLTRLEQLWLSDSIFGGPFPREGEEINLPSVTKLYLRENGVTMCNILELFKCAERCDITLSVVSRDVWQRPMLARYMSSMHPKDAHIYIYIGDGSTELQCDENNAHYTFKSISYSRMPHASELVNILPHSATSLSLVCDESVAVDPVDLYTFCEASRRFSSLTVCGWPLVLSLGTCLSEDTQFLPSLSLLHICDCSADFGGQFIDLREDMEVRIGGITLCRGSRDTPS